LWIPNRHFLLAELNGLDLWATYIGNTYFESYTTEKLYIIAGPKFKERQDHTLIIVWALYSLKSRGQCWHDPFHDCMIELGWQPCKSENDIWVKKNNNVWEYVAVYLDHLAIAMKDPDTFTKALMAPPYNYKLMGTG